MYKKSTSGQKFKKKWEKQRLKKTKFILYHGVFINAIYMGNIIYWLSIYTINLEFEWKWYLYTILFFGISGIQLGFWWYNNNEKRYFEILKWEEEEKYRDAKMDKLFENDRIC